MKDLSTKIENTKKALATLEKALKREWQDDSELRDAVIQRFEFSIETCWKLYKAYFEYEGVKLAAPKAVFRQMHEAGYLSYEETEFALEMVDDRNDTSHTYNEKLAIEIAAKVPSYYEFLKKALEKFPRA